MKIVSNFPVRTVKTKPFRIQAGPEWKTSPSVPSIEQVVKLLLAAREKAHLLHFSSTKYSTHIALSELYEQLDSTVDVFVEVYQGQYGLLETENVGTDPEVFPQKDYLEFIGHLSEFVLSVSKSFPLAQDTHLVSLWDDIVSIVLRAKYKLENLQ
jgi:hypothetical protein